MRKRFPPRTSRNHSDTCSEENHDVETKGYFVGSGKLCRQSNGGGVSICQRNHRLPGTAEAYNWEGSVGHRGPNGADGTETNAVDCRDEETSCDTPDPLAERSRAGEKQQDEALSLPEPGCRNVVELRLGPAPRLGNGPCRSRSLETEMRPFTEVEHRKFAGSCCSSGGKTHLTLPEPGSGGRQRMRSTRRSSKSEGLTNFRLSVAHRVVA